MAGITVARRGVTTGHGSGDLPKSVVSVSSPDTGANAAARIAVAHEAPLNVEWPEYGARTAAADNTAAIQAAINALPQAGARGGKIILPGQYTCTGQLVIDHLVGVALEGVTYQGGYGNTPQSGIVFTGLGAGTNNALISARSSSNLVLRGLSVRYTNASYVGHMIDLSHAPSGSMIDSGGWLIEGCHLGGDYVAQVYGAAALLALDKAILGTVRKSYFQFAARGARGNQTGYSNAITFDGCTFDNFTVAALTDADETWNVTNCYFEGTAGLTGTGLRRVYYQELASSSFNGLQMIGCWIGDIVNASFKAIELPAAATVSNGLVLIGNNFEHTTDALDATGGLIGAFIGGNRFSASAGNGIRLPVSASPGSTNVAVIGNQWPGGGGIINYASGQTDLVALANHNSSTPNLLPQLGQVGAAGVVGGGAACTVTVGTAAGAGATASINSNGITGTITLNTGTGPSAGQQVKLNFGTAFTTNGPGGGINDWAPKVFLSPANANAGANAAGFWHDDSNGGTTYSEIKSNTAPTPSVTYIWRYMIAQ